MVLEPPSILVLLGSVVAVAVGGRRYTEIVKYELLDYTVACRLLDLVDEPCTYLRI